MGFLAAVGGKYAPFVWGAYAVSAAVFAWMLVDTLARGRAARRRLERLERGEAAGGERK